MNSTRLQNIANRIGFNIGVTPFLYLGVPIFRGKPKASHLRPIADKVKIKLSAWKASLLSLAGRVQLIKSVIHGMLMHTFLIYSWPMLNLPQNSQLQLISKVESFIHEVQWQLCSQLMGLVLKYLKHQLASHQLRNNVEYLNQARFNNVKPCLRSAKAFIMSNTVISGNATKATSTNSMSDFLVIKAFNVKINSPKAPSIKEIFWMPPKSLDKMQHGRGSN
ncbi:RNA-directed DNA polymerase (Reverse transcriptase), partial [Trifolium medium]|nr:RNA-directed DNA polymerase (Reverse transcriptase) [Trifolium medium]